MTANATGDIRCFLSFWMDVYEGSVYVAGRMAGLRTSATGTSGISDSGGVAHGPGRRLLGWGGVMYVPPRRRGVDGLRGEAKDRPRYSPPSRLRRRSMASCDRRLSRSSHAAYFALMRASSTLPGFRMSEWRDSNPRPRGPQPRALPTAPHSVARRPGLEPGLTVLETAVLPIAPPTQRKASATPRAPARPSERQTPRTPPKSPEPDSNRRPAAYEAAALPLGHRGEAVPPIAFSMHVESLSARVPCRARHGRNRLVEPAGFGPATFPLRTGCATSAPRPRAIPSLYAREGTVGKGVIQVAALRRWCPRPDSNRRRPP